MGGHPYLWLEKGEAALPLVREGREGSLTTGQRRGWGHPYLWLEKGEAALPLVREGGGGILTSG